MLRNSREKCQLELGGEGLEGVLRLNSHRERALPEEESVRMAGWAISSQNDVRAR